ncbi:MAG: Cof-type HAD-IIB family hydrolase, partial [Bacillaceae bacterium]
MSKIVFFDIDGTLLKSDGTVDQDNISVIDALHKKNIHTFIASGRLPADIQPILEKTGIQSFISLNGQYIVHENEVMYESPLPSSQCRDFAQFCHTNHLIYGFHTPHFHYVSHGHDENVFKPYNHSSTPKVDAHIFEKEAVYQGLLYCTPEWIPLAQKHFPHFKFVQWGEHHYDVLPKQVSKASAISHVLHILNLSRQDAFAFGDALNDLEMFEHVGTSVAMGNALPQLKEKASMVTRSNDYQGIRFAFE